MGYMGDSNRHFTFELPITLGYAASGPLQIRQRYVYHMIRAFNPDTFGVERSAQLCLALP
jgi:hypothetical protein